MPEISLTLQPTDLMPSHALANLWAAEVLAHSFYPGLKETENRKIWVESVQRRYADVWALNLCILQSADPSEYRHWHELHALTQMPDRQRQFRENEKRDLRFAALILVYCALRGMSKAKAIDELARRLVDSRSANSMNSARMMVNRAWQKFSAASHYIAGWQLLHLHSIANGAATAAPWEIFSVAERLREIAETTVPHHGRQTILDPNTTWRLPPSFPLSHAAVLDISDGMIRIKFERRTPMSANTAC